MSDPRRSCPQGHEPFVHWGEEVDILYCPDCGWEDKIVLEKKRAGVRRTELSVRDRGGGEKKQGRVRRQG